jgi:hypothetical protein
LNQKEMGCYLPKPNTETDLEDQDGCGLRTAAGAMQGWRVTQEDAHNVIVSHFSTCLQKTAGRTGFLFQKSTSRQVSLDKLFSGPFSRQESRMWQKTGNTISDRF